MDIESSIERRRLELQDDARAKSKEGRMAKLRERHIDTIFGQLMTPEGLPIQDIETLQQENDDGLNFLRMTAEAKDTLKGFVRSYLEAGVTPPYIEQGWAKKGAHLLSMKQSYGTHGWLMPIGRLSIFYDQSVGPDDHVFLPAIITPRHTLAMPLMRFMPKPGVDHTMHPAVVYSEEEYASSLSFFKKRISEIGPATDFERNNISYGFGSDIAINGVINRIAQTGVRWSNS